VASGLGQHSKGQETKTLEVPGLSSCLGFLRRAIIQSHQPLKVHHEARQAKYHRNHPKHCCAGFGSLLILPSQHDRDRMSKETTPVKYPGVCNKGQTNAALHHFGAVTIIQKKFFDRVYSKVSLFALHPMLYRVFEGYNSTIQHRLTSEITL
jgi:hypothetical protein